MMQGTNRRTAPQPPPPGGWPASSAPSSSPQGLETRSRKRARTHSASSPYADSNGTASAYKTWLQGIDPQTTGKPAHASYIGAKVAQHFDNTGWGVGVVCCITADPHRKSVTRTPAPDVYPTTPIPSQRRITQQLTKQWPQFWPCVSTTLARVLRSSTSSPCLKGTRPGSRNQACAWR
jgi:hypothetical protein